MFCCCFPDHVCLNTNLCEYKGNTLRVEKVIFIMKSQGTCLYTSISSATVGGGGGGRLCKGDQY